MEDNYNNAEEEKNIFYEYFSKLEKPDGNFEIPRFEEIKDAYNNVKKKYESLMILKEKELNIILENHINKTDIIFSATKLLLKKVPTNEHEPFSIVSTKFIKLAVTFFKQYKLVENSTFEKTISKIEKFVSWHNIDLDLCTIRNLFNIIEHIYTIVLCIEKKDNYQYYNRGYKILGINQANTVFKILLNIATNIIFDKSFVCNYQIFTKLVKGFIMNILCNKNSNLNEDILKEFKTYLTFADKASDYSRKRGQIQEFDGIDYLRIKEFYNAKKLANSPNFKFDFKNGVAGTGWINEQFCIIGFSGTQNFMMFLVDLSQIQDLSPAYIFAAGFVDFIKDKYSNKNIVLCGHSLGGGLSQFAAAPHKGEIKAYCYNSAGLIGTYCKIRKFKEDKSYKNIYHYRLKWDIVSAFGALIGIVYTQKVKFSFLNHCRKALKKSLGL